MTIIMSIRRCPKEAKTAAHDALHDPHIIRCQHMDSCLAEPASIKTCSELDGNS